MNLLETLHNAGFNHLESKLYLHLIEQGEQPASKVATATGTARTTTRNTLDQLCERGILKKLYRRNTQYYSCNSASHLLKDLEAQQQKNSERIQVIKKELPLIEALMKDSHIAPKVQVFEGVDQVIEAFNHSLYQESEELLFFTSYEFLNNEHLQKNDDDFFIPMRVKKGIPLRVLVGKTNLSHKNACTTPNELRERRTIPEKYHLPGNIHIYGHYVVYFSVHNKEHFAVLIESQLMAETLRTLFNYMWETVEST